MKALSDAPAPHQRWVTWVVAALATASLMTWLVQSRAVALWVEQASFLTFVLKSFLQTPVVHPLPFKVPASTADALFGVLGAAVCIGTGTFVARSLRHAPHAAPVGWLMAIAIAVIPPTLLAAMGWPDGRGMITSGMIVLAQGVLALMVLAGLQMLQRANPAHGNTAVSPDVIDAEPHGAGMREVHNVGDAVPAMHPHVLTLLTILAVVYWVIILLAGLSGLQGYDSFSDHIARPARWLVTGRLEPGIDGEVVTYYPGNFELVVRWLLAFGSDRFAFLASYASSLASTWVVYRLAREIGQSVTAARLSALAAASLQVLAYQSIVVYSDTFTALCLLLATWVLLLWVRGGGMDRSLSLAFGLALGIAMGAKYSAGPPAVVLTLFWAWYASRGPQREGFDQPLVDWGALIRQGLWYTAGVLPGMVFWYARNALRDGNPLYPLSVAGLPGIPLDNLLAGAPGPRTFWERLSYPWTETGHILGFETGLGATVATVVVMAVIMGPWTGRGSRLHRLLWLVLLVVAFAWVRTGVLVPRYGFFPILLAFVFVGSLLTAFPSRWLRGVTATAIALTMIGVGFQLAGGAAYNMLFYDARPPVPVAIDTLPGSYILNLAAQPSGYYAMGADYRHRVLTPFRHYTSDDVRKTGAAYLLVLESEEATYTRALPMQLVERWSRTNWPSTALWRLE